MTSFLRLSRPRVHTLGSLGVAAFVLASASGGCAQILGLGDYQEGAGGSTGSSTGTVNTTSATMTTTSTGSTSSDASSSGSGGTGGGPNVTCTTQGPLVDVFTGDDLDSRAVASTFEPNDHVTLVAVARNGGGMSSVTVGGIRDNGQVLTPASYDFTGGGGTSVDALVLAAGGDLIAYVRAGNKLGEVHFGYSNGQFLGTPTFTPYTDIPDAMCDTGGHINRFTFERPVDPAHPRWVAVCRDNTFPVEKVYVGTPTTGLQVSQEAQDEPADSLSEFISIGNGREIIFAGGDPSDGAHYRFGTTPAELATKHLIVADSDPNRTTIQIASAPDGSGGVLVFVATLDKTTFTPAHIFSLHAAGDALADLEMQPPPGLTPVVDLDSVEDLAGFAPLVVSPGHLAGAGSSVDRKNVIFTYLKADGTLLTRVPVRQADAGLSIDQASAVSTSAPTFYVLWNEGNQTNQTIHAQAMLCIGG